MKYSIGILYELINGFEKHERYTSLLSCQLNNLTEVNPILKIKYLNMCFNINLPNSLLTLFCQIGHLTFQLNDKFVS